MCFAVAAEAATAVMAVIVVVAVAVVRISASVSKTIVVVEPQSVYGKLFDTPDQTLGLLEISSAGISTAS